MAAWRRQCRPRSLRLFPTDSTPWAGSCQIVFGRFSPAAVHGRQVVALGKELRQRIRAPKACRRTTRCSVSVETALSWPSRRSGEPARGQGATIRRFVGSFRLAAGTYLLPDFACPDINAKRLTCSRVPARLGTGSASPRRKTWRLWVAAQGARAASDSVIGA
jgi:hypothetical protein